MKETKGQGLGHKGERPVLHVFFQVILKFLHKAFHINLRTSSPEGEVN